MCFSHFFLRRNYTVWVSSVGLFSIFKIYSTLHPIPLTSKCHWWHMMILTRHVSSVILHFTSNPETFFLYKLKFFLSVPRYHYSPLFFFQYNLFRIRMNWCCFLDFSFLNLPFFSFSILCTVIRDPSFRWRSLQVKDTDDFFFSALCINIFFEKISYLRLSHSRLFVIPLLISSTLLNSFLKNIFPISYVLISILILPTHFLLSVSFSLYFSFVKIN